MGVSHIGTTTYKVWPGKTLLIKHTQHALCVCVRVILAYAQRIRNVWVFADVVESADVGH